MNTYTSISTIISSPSRRLRERFPPFLSSLLDGEEETPLFLGGGVASGLGLLGVEGVVNLHVAGRKMQVQVEHAGAQTAPLLVT